MKLGASPSDLVPFEKYAAPRKGWCGRPRRRARSAMGCRTQRTDRLVQMIARQKGMSTRSSTPTVRRSTAARRQPQEGGRLDLIAGAAGRHYARPRPIPLAAAGGAGRVNRRPAPADF